uniref:hypothetical protein n=1 Tax=Streptomyces sp. S501 TaxID=2420135 RepID=UPI001F10F8BB|nr:hypothetical protein [Streptomyces sp. S501]
MGSRPRRSPAGEVTHRRSQSIAPLLLKPWAGARALGIRIHPAAAAAALALSFATHYAADRRVPGKGLLEKLATKTGKGGFYQLDSHGINGAFQLDSAWHHGWETVAALVATTKATTR